MNSWYFGIVISNHLKQIASDSEKNGRNSKNSHPISIYNYNNTFAKICMSFSGTSKAKEGDKHIHKGVPDIHICKKKADLAKEI